MLPKVSIKLFRAVDEEVIAQAYVLNHLRVLEEFKLANLSSVDDSWTRNPNVYMLIAENETDMLGGIRIHIADGAHLLPLEEAVGDQDNNVCAMVEERRLDGGTSELCGLWNSRKCQGWGIAFLLSLSGLAVANQFNITTMLTFVAAHTRHIANKLGFVVDNSLGFEGSFIYPDERFITEVLGVVDTITLETAEERYKNIMLEIRNNSFMKKEMLLNIQSLMVEFHLNKR